MFHDRGMNMTDHQKLDRSSLGASFSSIDRPRFLTLFGTASVAAIIGPAAQAQQPAFPSVAPGWSAADIPPQNGRTVVITGGNGVPQTMPEGTADLPVPHLADQCARQLRNGALP